VYLESLEDSMTDLATLARRIRHADWWAQMSDDSGVWNRHDADVAWMRATVARLDTKAASRVWELGTLAAAIAEGYTATDETRFDTAWRWAGAYCWAHGVRLTEVEAQVLVGRTGSGATWVVDWRAVDALVLDGRETGAAR
jgi:hypothetical protein